MDKTSSFATLLIGGLIIFCISCKNTGTSKNILDQPHTYPATEIYLVRHAEKELNQENPPLTAEGEERASSLSKRLKEANVQYIHSSNFRRTISTAQPTADRLGLSIELYNHKDLEGLKKKILGLGGTHLVVGHSNSTPSMVELLGGDPGSPINEHSEYDRLYHIEIQNDSLVESKLVRYGKKYTATDIMDTH